MGLTEPTAESGCIWTRRRRNAAPLARRQRRARPWRPAQRTPGRLTTGVWLWCSSRPLRGCADGIYHLT